MKERGFVKNQDSHFYQRREEWIVGELAVSDTIIQLVNELDCGIWLESRRNGIITFIFLKNHLRYEKSEQALTNKIVV